MTDANLTNGIPAEWSLCSYGSLRRAGSAICTLWPDFRHVHYSTSSCIWTFSFLQLCNSSSLSMFAHQTHPGISVFLITAKVLPLPHNPHSQTSQCRLEMNQALCLWCRFCVSDEENVLSVLCPYSATDSSEVGRLTPCTHFYFVCELIWSCLWCASLCSENHIK